jgi:hypothetical protein
MPKPGTEGWIGDGLDGASSRGVGALGLFGSGSNNFQVSCSVKKYLDDRLRT